MPSTVQIRIVANLIRSRLGLLSTSPLTRPKLFWEFLVAVWDRLTALLVENLKSMSQFFYEAHRPEDNEQPARSICDFPSPNGVIARHLWSVHTLLTPMAATTVRGSRLAAIRYGKRSSPRC
jgi:hypothetical protein